MPQVKTKIAAKLPQFGKNVVKLPQNIVNLIRKIMATVTYEFGKPKQDKTRKVSIVISHKGQRKRIPTSISLSDDDITKSGKIASRKVQKIIDDKLNEIKDKLYDLEVDLMGNAVDVDWIMANLSKKESTLDFFEFAEKWIEKSTNKGINNYKITLNSLERYNGCRKLQFSVIDYSFLDGYKSFLDGHPRAQSLYLGIMRHLFNEAIREYNTGLKKIIENNPFDSFKIPRDIPQTKDRVISEENLVKVFNFKGTRRVAMARDCYILSFCLIGMNSVDLYNCTDYKNGILSYDRSKTKDKRADNAHIEVIVPDIIKNLFKKYKGTSKVFDFSKRYSTPQNFNKNINKGLHTIADELDIPRFDFYSARHTWASIARNKLGIDKYTIHEALNHVSDISVTDIYIQKDYSIVNKANEKVMMYFENLIKQANQ